MSITPQNRWGRLSAEVVTIVVGILLAFAIDAWWQDRSERRIEAQYLLALQDDMIASLELLREDDATERLQIQYLESLMRADGETPDSAEIRIWIEDGLFTVGTYEPQLSSLRDLESSGQTRIIQDTALRRSLASLSTKLESLESIQGDFLLSQQLLIDPFLVDNFDLAGALQLNSNEFELDLSVVDTLEFRSRVAFKLSLREIVSRTKQEVRAGFEDALALIDARLETIR